MPAPAARKIDVNPTNLKLECEKLASEKTEMQRHYVMYYEMSYGLNIEMHKQAEIVKRLNAICAQVIPFLSQEHQQQVVQAVERAKQVTMAELNAIIGPPAIPPIGSSAGLLALSSALGGQSHLPIKDEKKHHDNDHQRDLYLKFFNKSGECKYGSKGENTVGAQESISVVMKSSATVVW
ncbi:Transducin-like enhancer protein 4 [Tupaia chinensis]|uniref:Transducin-like enhancer protein 4 n=1 Tax=Tupaia chinensis TaxID=246437 RepID=L9KZT3_TUPCH|nr:Transducin-like enhancer protein 4 [Tupaia chinensis]